LPDLFIPKDEGSGYRRDGIRDALSISKQIIIRKHFPSLDGFRLGEEGMKGRVMLL
jgi:hypothetical protein